MISKIWKKSYIGRMTLLDVNILTIHLVIVRPISRLSRASWITVNVAESNANVHEHCTGEYSIFYILLKLCYKTVRRSFSDSCSRYLVRVFSLRNLSNSLSWVFSMKDERLIWRYDFVKLGCPLGLHEFLSFFKFLQGLFIKLIWNYFRRISFQSFIIFFIKLLCKFLKILNILRNHEILDVMGSKWNSGIFL